MYIFQIRDNDPICAVERGNNIGFNQWTIGKTLINRILNDNPITLCSEIQISRSRLEGSCNSFVKNRNGCLGGVAVPPWRMDRLLWIPSRFKQARKRHPPCKPLMQ